MSRDVFSHDPRTEPERDSHASPSSGSARVSDLSRDVEVQAGEHDRGSSEKRPHPSQRQPEALDSPRARFLGKRVYFLRESELQTLVEVGTFRAVAAQDLGRIGYGGDAERMEREIRRLRRQLLLTEKVVCADRTKTVRLFALTRRGARLARSSGVVPEGQAIYHGFVKPREAQHDADLYRLYNAHAEKIEQAGGRLTQVILDYELKRDLNRELATLSPELQSDEARERIAKRHGLCLVNGKIPVPDMRVEYDTADMEHRHVDLELATRSYRPRALAEKAKAGFSLYARRDDAQRLRRMMDERETPAEILSL